MGECDLYFKAREWSIRLEKVDLNTVHSQCIDSVWSRAQKALKCLYIDHWCAWVIQLCIFLLSYTHIFLEVSFLWEAVLIHSSFDYWWLKPIEVSCAVLTNQVCKELLCVHLTTITSPLLTFPAVCWVTLRSPSSWSCVNTWCFCSSNKGSTSSGQASLTAASTWCRTEK